MTFEGWSEFNVAMAGATAALAGLIIVAISVNIGQIVKIPHISSRAAASIATLTIGVVVSGIGLIPGQPMWLVGVEVLVLVAIAWVTEVHSIRRIARNDRITLSPKLAQIALGALAPAAYTVGGIMLLAGASGGVYALAVGTLLAILSGVLIAWVALVEILR